jgi:hypothetical protein
VSHWRARRTRALVGARVERDLHADIRGRRERRLALLGGDLEPQRVADRVGFEPIACETTLVALVTPAASSETKIRNVVMVPVPTLWNRPARKFWNPSDSGSTSSTTPG